LKDVVLSLRQIKQESLDGNGNGGWVLSPGNLARFDEAIAEKCTDLNVVDLLP
jgi:hypothetical protein